MQSPSKEEKQEGLEEARILGQEKEKEREREKAPEQAKVEEQGDKTVQVRGVCCYVPDREKGQRSPLISAARLGLSIHALDVPPL